MSTTKKGRGQRRNRRNNPSIPRPVPIHLWGRDHWSTLAYIATRCAGKGGQPDKRNMRCHPKRHPHHAHIGTRLDSAPPTRLIGKTNLFDHDDWDCVDDMIAAGLVEAFGTGMFPAFGMTPAGHAITQWQFEQERKRLPWSTVPRSIWSRHISGGK